MQEKMQALLDRAIGAWNGLDKSQKIKLSSVALLFVIALGSTIYLIIGSKMVVILKNQDQVTIAQAYNALTDAGIRSSQISSFTGLEVNEKDSAQAKYVLNELNIPKSEGVTFVDVLDTISLGASDRIVNEMLKLLQQDEIAKMLELYDSVVDAEVIFTVPNDTDVQQVVAASVFLETAGRISEKQAQEMAQLVCKSVQNLDLDRIEILDNFGNSIYSGIEGADIDLATTVAEVN